MKVRNLFVMAVVVVTAPHVVAADDSKACPEAFRGASITTATIHDGVTLTFTTEHARIATLRDVLRAVAMELQRRGTEVQTASYDEDVGFPPIELDVFDVSGGARVSVRASRPRDIPGLRELATSFAKYWATSECNGDVVVQRESHRPKTK
jgi:hypothetical protein